MPVSRCVLLLRNASGTLLLLGLTACFAGAPDTAVSQFPAPTPPDAQLEVLREELAPLRVHPPANKEDQNAGPVLMAAKQKLRLWIESQIPSFDQYADRDSFIHGLNEQLARSDLFCSGSSDKPDKRCVVDNFQDDSTGFLNKVTVRTWGDSNEILIQTTVGVTCGYDESAYLYEWLNPGWRLIWKDEFDTSKSEYHPPRSIESIHLSRTGAPDYKDRLILSAGVFHGCASNWQNVFYGLWRIDQGASEPVVLAHEEQFAYHERFNSAIEANVSDGDALVEFYPASLDSVVHHRTAVRHYKIVGDEAVRIDPFALNVRGFVEEWLGTPWEKAREWTEPVNRDAISKFHLKPDENGAFFGDYTGSSQRCAKAGDLWQVGVDFLSPPSFKTTDEIFFLVRWRPPFRFRMVDARSTPFPDCTESDDDADAEYTLFSDTN